MISQLMLTASLLVLQGPVGGVEPPRTAGYPAGR